MSASHHIGKQRVDIKQHRIFKADFRAIGFKITEFLRIFQNAPSSRHPVFTALPADGMHRGGFMLVIKIHDLRDIFIMMCLQKHRVADGIILVKNVLRKPDAAVHENFPAINFYNEASAV